MSTASINGIRVMRGISSPPSNGQVAVWNATTKQWDPGAGGGGGGGGDFSSNTATSVDGEVVLFSGTAGKTGKRATGSGLAKLTAGVLGTGTAGTDYVSPSSTETLTNKRIAPRVRQQTDVATLTPNFDTYDFEELTAQAQALTIAAPTGTPQNFEPRFIVVKTAAAQTIAWNAAYVDGGATLTRPTQTQIGINEYAFRYSTTKAAYVLHAKLEGI